jgi:hypothetical protein
VYDAIYTHSLACALQALACRAITLQSTISVLSALCVCVLTTTVTAAATDYCCYCLTHNNNFDDG